MSKRSYKVSKDGKAIVPFHYPYTLQDWGGDEEAMANDLDLYQDQFETMEKNLLPAEPHPMTFENREADPRYVAQLQAGQIAKAVEGAVSNALAAANPRRQVNPRELPRDVQVLTRGNGGDKEHFRKVQELRRVVEDQRAKAQLHPDRALDFEDRANSFQRDIDRLESGHKYSFEQADLKENMKWARERLAEANKFSAAEIKEALPIIENLVQGWRDVADEEVTFVVEDPAAPSSRNKSFRVVELSHPGKSSKVFSQDKTDDDLIGMGYGLGYISSWEDDKPEKPARGVPIGEADLDDYEIYLRKETAKDEARAKAIAKETLTFKPVKAEAAGKEI